METNLLLKRMQKPDYLTEEEFDLASRSQLDKLDLDAKEDNTEYCYDCECTCDDIEEDDLYISCLDKCQDDQIDD